MPATDTLSQENEDFMTILARLEHWKQQGSISPEQHTYLASLCRGEPFSLFLELNVLLYAGVLAFVAGLGWTVTTWSRQLGDVVVLTVLSTILAACFWYCFSRAPAWCFAETPAHNAIFDYVLYLGSLVWCVELAYVENRFHVLSGVFERQGYGLWFLALLIACGASLAWGLTRRQFAFVAYSAVYGYVGLSSVLIRGITDETFILSYFVVTAVAMLVVLIQIARRFGRPA